MEYFKKNNISIELKVNDLLKDYGSSFKLKSSPDLDPIYGDQVRLNHLMNHTALNLHYVNGAKSDEGVPTLEKLVFGNDDLGYEPIAVISKPGERFKYSGADLLSCSI